MKTFSLIKGLDAHSPCLAEKPHLFPLIEFHLVLFHFYSILHDRLYSLQDNRGRTRHPKLRLSQSKYLPPGIDHTEHSACV